MHHYYSYDHEFYECEKAWCAGSRGLDRNFCFMAAVNEYWGYIDEENRELYTLRTFLTKMYSELSISSVWDLNQIEVFTFPEYTREICEYAFFEGSLNYVSIPEGVKRIGEGAFMDSGIREIYIPESVETMGDFTFADTSYGDAFDRDNYGEYMGYVAPMVLTTLWCVPDSYAHHYAKEHMLDHHLVAVKEGKTSHYYGSWFYKDSDGWNNRMIPMEELEAESEYVLTSYTKEMNKKKYRKS